MKNLFQKHEIQFIAWFCGIFIASVIFLSMVGLLPSELTPGGGRTFEQVTRDAVREIVEGKPVDTDSPEPIGPGPAATIDPVTDIPTTPGSPAGAPADAPSQIQTSSGDTMYAEEPIRLVISSIGVDTVVSNPKTTAFETLDAALTRSAVRYPGSGLPGLGNMFIFGHSTGFSVVQNQAYKVFNKLKDVRQGATVTVYSKSATYEYKVTSVRLVDKTKALVEFDTKNNMLTLSTCDSFGREQDRYVVEADLVSVRKL